MKRSFNTLALFLLLGIAAASASAKTPEPQFFLVKDRQPVSVFYAEKPFSPGMKKNIDDFNSELQKVTGSTIPFTMKKPEKGLNRIEIVTIPYASCATEDQFFMEFPDNRTMRIRGTEKSVWYAFRTILTEHAGINYLWKANDPVWIHYPEKHTVSLPVKNYSYAPSLPFMRLIWGTIRQRRRHTWIKGDERFMHNFPTQIFPVAKYAPDKWPEAIMPVINGKKVKLTDPCPKGDPRYHRAFSRWAPCFSAPETVTEAVANIEELLKKEPELKILGLFPNDNTPQCQCSKCLPAVKRSSTGKEIYSELYYRWANAVAERITKKHPDLIMITGAYLQNMEAPSFKLHKNLLPLLCFETWSAYRDPKVGQTRDQLLKMWQEKTSFFGIHDYIFGLRTYGLPRFNFKGMSAYYKKLYKMGLRAADPEGAEFSPIEGPKERFEDALFWNINTDPEQFLRKWCTDAVGEEAGMDLYRFYDFWQEYWMRPDLQKTSWYMSITSIYMSMADRTCIRALRPGELQALEKLLNSARKKVKTSVQKQRIEQIYQAFSVLKDLMTAYFAEQLPCSGILESREQALSIINNVIPAQKALKRLEKVKRLDLVGGRRYRNSFYEALALLNTFAGDPVVKQQMQKLIANPELLPPVRAMLKVMLGEGKYQNLLENKYFENRKALKSGLTGFEPVAILPGKVYYFSMKYMLSEERKDGRLNLQLVPFNNDTNVNHDWRDYILSERKPGKWVRYELAYVAPENKHFGKTVNALRIWIKALNFPSETPGFVEDMKLICLDDVK